MTCICNQLCIYIYIKVCTASITFMTCPTSLAYIIYMLRVISSWTEQVGLNQYFKGCWRQEASARWALSLVVEYNISNLRGHTTIHWTTRAHNREELRRWWGQCASWSMGHLSAKLDICPSMLHYPVLWIWNVSRWQWNVSAKLKYKINLACTDQDVSCACHRSNGHKNGYQEIFQEILHYHIKNLG